MPFFPLLSMCSVLRGDLGESFFLDQRFALSMYPFRFGVVSFPLSDVFMGEKRVIELRSCLFS